MNPLQFGLVSSSYTLGGLVGALLSGALATRYGRLLTLRITTIFFTIGPILEAAATHIEVMILGRFLSGIGAGASIVVGPIYIAEVAPAEMRGFFGSFTQVMTNVGILGTQTLGFFFSRGSYWRIILAIAAGIGAVEFLGLFLVPESPTWLVEHTNPNHAKRVLQRIRGANADISAEIKSWPTSTLVDEEESALLGQTNSPGQQPPKQPALSMFSALRSPDHRPAIIAVVGVMVAQQLTGINSIIMYSVSILSSILPTTASLITVIVSAIGLIVTLACTPLPDKLGRRKCLLISVTGLFICSILLATGMALGIKPLSAIATLAFVSCFALGLGPVPFILASELVGPEAVGAAQSWALAANWTATFVVAQFFPVVNSALGGNGRVYWGFAALSVFWGLFIWKKVPETKGKGSVEEVWGRGERRID